MQWSSRKMDENEKYDEKAKVERSDADNGDKNGKSRPVCDI